MWALLFEESPVVEVLRELLPTQRVVDVVDVRGVLDPLLVDGRLAEGLLLELGELPSEAARGRDRALRRGREALDGVAELHGLVLDEVADDEHHGPLAPREAAPAVDEDRAALLDVLVHEVARLVERAGALGRRRVDVEEREGLEGLRLVERRHDGGHAALEERRLRGRGRGVARARGEARSAARRLSLIHI